ncbi:MAG: TIR domain-containing protein [Chloroflexi bacterium]|nr:TIR domain-containing protein [Chloroflexota bacterium]
MRAEMSAEERDILDRFEKGELRSATDVEQEIKAAGQAAHNTAHRAGETEVTKTQDLRNVFVSHINEDEGGLPRLKNLLAQHGMICRDGPITTGKFNSASNEDYIKYEILSQRIKWANVLVVYISTESKDSDWVNWEIDYAAKEGKRIVGVWAWDEKGCDLPEALRQHRNALVGWNGESIIDAINGDSDKSYMQDGSEWDYQNVSRHCR